MCTSGRGIIMTKIAAIRKCPCKGNKHKNVDTTKIHIYMYACTYKPLTEVV